MTGVQRFTAEILNELKKLIDIRPMPIPVNGLAGHFIEQILMPPMLDEVLLSPANTGPIGVSNQILVLHDVSPLDDPHWFSQSFAKGYGLLLPSLTKSVGLIVTDSFFSREQIIERLKIHPSRVRVVHCGLRQELRMGPRYATREKFLLYVGSLEPRKNLRRLVKAWEMSGINDYELRIVGGISKIFGDSGVGGKLPKGIELLGRVSDEELDTLYRKSSGLIYPSLYEGFGFPPLEAMLRGCPSLVSVCGSLPEVCGRPFDEYGPHSHDQGFITRPKRLPAVRFGRDPGIPSCDGAVFYCDPWSAQNIAEGLVKLTSLSSSGFERIVENGFKRAALFSWPQAARRFSEIIKECQRPVI